jgi:sterol desaturase/sphingolipid hydroxylase (fatty acid hydroxylase superfamily)
VSPIQHQVHHSIDPRHRNKNFGVKFAVWDALFGTLYVPRQTETLRVGLPDADPREFSTVRQLYFLPFAKAIRRLSLAVVRPAVLQVPTLATTEGAPLFEKKT